MNHIGNRHDDDKKRNLYEVIIDDIMKKINQNDFSFEKPICTEKQLSDEYGVSRITAKRAIAELKHRGILYSRRGAGSYVSRDIYSILSSTTHSEDSKVFAFVLPFDITKGGLLDTVQVVNNVLNAAGYYMAIYIADNNTSKEKAVLKQLIGQNISGVVFYPMTNDIHLELLNSFVLKDKPVIIIDKSSDCHYIHGVVSDNSNGAEMLTEHLISLGHRNIAYLSRYGTAELSSIRDRFGGFISALKKHGIASRPENIITHLSGIEESSMEQDKSTTSLNNIISRLYKSGVTAIEAENDEVAYAILLACKDLGISVPEELSICGFDNSPWATKSQKEITTVEQDFQEIGKKISEIFLNSMDTSSPQIQKYVVPVQLFIGGTTAPPRNLDN